MANNDLFSAKTTLNIRGQLLMLDHPIVMGIINITPDSFYSKSRVNSIKDIIAKAEQMLAEGATILDIGGFSTRPRASQVSEEEELNRLLPALKEIVKNFPEAIISVDTFRAEIAKATIDSGASMINDITAGCDKEMFALIAETEVPYIIMHMRGPIEKMMENLHYDNIILEITNYFQKRLKELRSLGIKDIIIDPGFGFSKTLDQNYEILNNLAYFKALGTPLLVGVSRKSMIYNLLGTSASEALVGTSVANFSALEKGARILRVHDVKEAMETIKIYNKLTS